MQPFIGQHDRTPYIYPSIGAYPGNNDLINEFLNIK